MDVLRTTALILASAAVARLAWHVSPTLIPVSIVFPALVFHQRTRGAAALTALVYTATASWPVIEISAAYFGNDVALRILPWLAASVILAAPWPLLWTPATEGHRWRIPLALAISILPPVGLINWASPLTAAGPLYPGCTWFGIAAVVTVATAIALRSLAILAIAMLASAAAIMLHAESLPPDGWTAIDTEFGTITESNEFAVVESVQHQAASSKDRVVIFPEAIIPRWNEATKLFWQPISDQLTQRQATVIVGAGMQAAGNSRRNTVLALGRTTAALDQRIPVPIAMWKPLSEEGVPLRVNGQATITIDNQRPAFFICYEQLLPWSYLSAATEHPTIMIGIANASWTKQTIVPTYQRAVLRCWARLFGRASLSATNY